MAFRPPKTLNDWDKSAEKALPAQLVELNTHLKAFELRLSKVVDSLGKVQDPHMTHTEHQLKFLLQGTIKLKEFMPAFREYIDGQAKAVNPRGRGKAK